ncbi:MAG: dual-specificity RNA methyltransferase RlmN [Candidatus Poribacteria bacterium]|nr:MAG: dual-specificity RNA methyltransferase RlmN [Candidatus Poribacteria bacterium]
MERISLLGMNASELATLMEAWGQPRYRGMQLFRWLYHRRAREFSAMTDLPASLRERLAEAAEIVWPRVVRRDRSALDGTTKYLLELADGERIESVLLYDEDRLTLCISSQVGCLQGCTFCATALLGLRRNMTAGEIVGQYLVVEEEIGVGTITNLVFMGMGEPLANYPQVVRAIELLSDPQGIGLSQRRMTVSTSGLVPAIERLATSGLRVGLALSLNATTDAVRDRLIPSNRRYKISGVLAACRRWAQATGQPVTIEYVLLEGVNDTDKDAVRLARLARSLPAKVNLIPYNEVMGLPWRRPDAARVARFQQALRERGVLATVRKTKGRDIAAACGQLRASDPSSASVELSSVGS